MAHQFGAHGVIRESDLGAKRAEFQAWAIETQNVDIEILGKVLLPAAPCRRRAVSPLTTAAERVTARHGLFDARGVGHTRRSNRRSQDRRVFRFNLDAQGQRHEAT